jgi:NADH dehydrogenase
MKSIFVTGGTGFIGRNLLHKIELEKYESIYCLTRNPEKAEFLLPSHENIRSISAELFDVDVYAPYLASADFVLHLAAATGKATPEQYFETNSKGTEVLVKQCEELGVKNFLYMSSIAVKFPDISGYYYAQSKGKGEDVVRNSTLNYTILRPTIVIGGGSAIWENLAKLAKLPMPIIFGNGKTKIQPVYIQDLVNILLTAIEEDNFSNKIFDIGGPEIITYENFLKAIRWKYYKKNSRFIHIPLGILVPILAFLEKYIRSFLPINTGQLSSFIYDSTIEENETISQQTLNMRRVNDMVSGAINDEKKEALDVALDEECKVFCRYLVNLQPNAYILEKYREGNKKSKIEQTSTSERFDRILVSISKFGRGPIKLADSYSRIMAKRSIFRRKLILLLAILETCQPYYRHLDTIDSCGRFSLFMRFLKNSLGFAVAFLFSALLLGPFHLFCSAISKSRG